MKVLSFISRVGESFWANQSVNGFLNRMLENGDPYGTNFAPYNPMVYVITLISTLIILALAFWLPKGSRPASGGSVDLSVILIAATIGSPVVWHHHYGIFLPIMAARSGATLGVLGAWPLRRGRRRPT